MKKVLIIDDAAFMRLSIKTMLTKNGFSVVGEAENGRVGIEKYMETNPDLVTLDITMPEMDGLETLEALKKLRPDARVLMISAMGQETMVRKAIALGAKSFLVKPFQEENLIAALNKL